MSKTKLRWSTIVADSKDRDGNRYRLKRACGGWMYEVRRDFALRYQSQVFATRKEAEESANRYPDNTAARRGEVDGRRGHPPAEATHDYLRGYSAGLAEREGPAQGGARR